MGDKLLKMYETMTADAQKELYDFAVFLLSKKETPIPTEQKQSIYGIWKNDDFYMSPDFDEPLEDFAEYM